MRHSEYFPREVAEGDKSGEKSLQGPYSGFIILLNLTFKTQIQRKNYEEYGNSTASMWPFWVQAYRGCCAPVLPSIPEEVPPGLMTCVCPHTAHWTEPWGMDDCYFCYFYSVMNAQHAAICELQTSLCKTLMTYNITAKGMPQGIAVQKVKTAPPIGELWISFKRRSLFFSYVCFCLGNKDDHYI